MPCSTFSNLHILNLHRSNNLWSEHFTPALPPRLHPFPTSLVGLCSSRHNTQPPSLPRLHNTSSPPSSSCKSDSQLGTPLPSEPPLCLYPFLRRFVFFKAQYIAVQTLSLPLPLPPQVCVLQDTVRSRHRCPDAASRRGSATVQCAPCAWSRGGQLARPVDGVSRGGRGGWVKVDGCHVDGGRRVQGFRSWFVEAVRGGGSLLISSRCSTLIMHALWMGGEGVRASGQLARPLDGVSGGGWGGGAEG